MGAAREYIPASVPFTHRACSGLKGASGGSTGTPGAPAGMPARKPTRYWRSCAVRTGGAAGARPKTLATPATSGAAAARSAPAAGTATASAPAPATALPETPEPAPSIPLPEAPGTAPAAPTAGVRTVTGVGTFVSDTAHTLNSGWNDSGSTASLVTALTLRYSPKRSFQ